MDNKDKLLNKTLVGLLTGQKALRESFGRTNQALEATHRALGTTISRVDEVVADSLVVEQRLEEVINVLGSMAERNADGEKWRRSADQRLASLEERLGKLEDAG